MKPKLLVAAHRHPWLYEPRGGEISVRTILNHLKEDFEIRVVVKNVPENREDVFDGVKVVSAMSEWIHKAEDWIEWADVALTWATAAPWTAQVCHSTGTPYILMVRWWRNIQPLPPADLLTRPADVSFIRNHQHIFSNAHAVFTNNDYACKVIRRFYGVDAIKSFVPISGEAEVGGDKDGYLLLVTPNKGVGEPEFLRKLAWAMPKQDIVVVNTPPDLTFEEKNIISAPYVKDMSGIYKSAKAVLMPVYHNDICGFTRVTMEAMRFGVPVIANDRCGMGEMVPNLVEHTADIESWCQCIETVEENYSQAQNTAKSIFSSYDSIAEMDKFKHELLKAI